MSKDIVITVKGEPDAAATVSANVMLIFRKLGVHPQLASANPAQVMRIGGDEWNAGNALQRLCQTPEVRVKIEDNPAEAVRPHVGAVAVVRKGKKILLGKRVKPGDPGHGKWVFPGGKIEAGETMRQALEREVREEVGLAVKAGDVITATQSTTSGNVAVILWAAQTDRVQRPQNTREIQDPKFYTLDEAEKLDVADVTREVFALVRAQLAAEAASKPAGEDDK